MDVPVENKGNSELFVAEASAERIASSYVAYEAGILVRERGRLCRISSMSVAFLENPYLIMMSALQKFANFVDVARRWDVD